MSNVEENDLHEENQEGEEVQELSFEELGLDPRLIRALTKKNIEKPTPIQQTGIPLILVSSFSEIIPPSKQTQFLSIE